MKGDEVEAQAQLLSVSNYHLKDGKRLPVSLAVLPIQWGDADDSDATKEQVFLHGFTDNLRHIMKQVTAWRFDLSSAKPEILLLPSEDKTWIKVQMPRNSFQDTVRTTLVAIHFLHRVKKDPNISAESVWDNLAKDKELSCYTLKPSREDLFDHMSLIGEAAKRDAALAKSKLLLTILKEKPGYKKLSDEVMKERLRNKRPSDEFQEVKDLMQPAFIDDDIDLINEVPCAICDNGGCLLGCEGPCMRSFHAEKRDGILSMCDSLGLTRTDIERMQQGFVCKNCKYNQHQCFACGGLGSSGAVMAAEVIKCTYATCHHFYHPHCAAELLPQRNIADVNSFTCPVHYCCVCEELENPRIPELQFAVCRRCPKSYHRKCLPREIAFEDINADIRPRAWEGLLSNNRVLIYCLNHEIDEVLGTPIRDHIKFPN